MNLDWLLSQVFSYVNRFYLAIASPKQLITMGTSSGDKQISEAMIFLVISTAIAGVGFDFLTNTQSEFPKDMISAGLVFVLMAILASAEVFVAWRIAGSQLPFDVFLRGTAYNMAVLAVLTMILSYALFGIRTGIRPERIQETRLAIWSAFVRPIEIFADDFPENTEDKIAIAVGLVANWALLLGVWWRAYSKLSALTWRHALWALVTFIALEILLLELLTASAIRSL